MALITPLVFVCAGMTKVAGELCYSGGSYYSSDYGATTYYKDSAYCSTSYTGSYYYYASGYRSHKWIAAILSGISLGVGLLFIILRCICCQKTRHPSVQGGQTTARTAIIFTPTSDATTSGRSPTRPTAQNSQSAIRVITPGGQEGMVMKPLRGPPPSYDDICQNKDSPPVDINP